MKGFKLVFPLLAAVAVTASCTKESVAEDGTAAVNGPIVINEGIGSIVNGELFVKIKPSSTKSAGSAEDAKAGTTEISEILAQNGRFSLERLFPECGKFEERTRAEGLDRWYVASFDRKIASSDVVRQLRKCGSIECIEYSIAPTLADGPAAPFLAAQFSAGLFSAESFSAGTFSAESFSAVPEKLNEVSPASSTASSPASSAASSSAPSLASVSRKAVFPFNESSGTQQRQWHYNNTGSLFGKTSLAGADADVWAAWNLSKGNPDVIVAVIDQGVKFDHEDLKANMWVNGGEIPGNGIDDDGNGYIDDIYGFNFIDNSGTITTSSTLSHGTHVAGTIAAVNNNGIGVNGIAGGSGNGDGVKIMSLQSLGSSDSGSSGAGLGGTVRAMKYAADNGAVICQNSWGYNQKLSWNTWTRSSFGALRRAMDYFIKYAGVDENGNQSGPMKGGIIIFAAGNEAVSYDSYPAADENVISVAAHSYAGNAAIYTNYGSWVDISAPGGDTYVDSQYGGVYSTLVGEDGGSAYGYMQGTSMACPHVSGACALAVSYYYGAEKRQGLTPDKLKAALLSSAAPFSGSLSSTYEGKMGVGKLDTYALLRYMDFLDDIPGRTVSVGETVGIDLAAYFPSLQAVSFSVSDPSVAEAALSGETLRITGLSAGKTVVTVSNGGSLYKEIEITVSK